MKGVSAVKASSNPPHSIKDMNLKLNQQNLQHSQVCVAPGPDEIVASQAQYIDNLQQQVYFLENEILCLRNHMELNNKSNPTMFAEAEKMVKKLAEAQKEIQTMKIDLKRKQTTIDLFKSEKERILRKMEEVEVIFQKQKSACLEEIIELKKEKDEYSDKSIELERMMHDSKLQELNLQGDYDNLHVQVEQLKQEMLHDKNIMSNLKKEKEELQQAWFEVKMHLETKSMSDREEALNHMKTEIQELQEQLTTAGRMAEHERLLRSRLSDDNAVLIKRHADLEGELAEVKALLREEQSLRTSLEEVNLKVVVDASEIKSREVTLKAELDELNSLLKTEKDRSFQFASQLADEQRFRAREEQKVSHAEKRLEQRDERVKTRERENTELQRDNAFFKDQVPMLKQQLRDRDIEVESLKCKVQDMQVSVEEFIQSSRAANGLEKQRWKQLTQLAQGIQSLSKEAMVDQEI